MHRARTTGISRLEFAIVLAIVGILVTIAVPRLGNMQNKARAAKLQEAHNRVAASVRMLHSAALSRSQGPDSANCPGTSQIADNKPGEKGTLCGSGGIIQMVFGYPAVTPLGGAPGILAAAGLVGSFNPTRNQLETEGFSYSVSGGKAVFGVHASVDPNYCFFEYTHPTGPSSTAVIGDLTISGC